MIISVYDGNNLVGTIDNEALTNNAKRRSISADSGEIVIEYDQLEEMMQDFRGGKDGPWTGNLNG